MTLPLNMGKCVECLEGATKSWSLRAQEVLAGIANPVEGISSISASSFGCGDDSIEPA